MRTATLIVLVACVAIASAGKLSSNNANRKVMGSEAHFEAMKNTPFGENLFNMLSLKFKATGQVDDIVSLLDTLSNTITAQQQDDDSQFQTTSAAYQATIDQQNAIIVEATQNIADWTNEINIDTDKVAQDTNQLRSIQTEIDNINSFLKSLTEKRERERDAFTQRTNDQTALIAGLDQVIALFSSEIENNSNLDADSVDAIMDLFNEIRAGLEASIADDTEAEEAAEVAYKHFVHDETSYVDELTDQINALKAEIAGLNTVIDTDTQKVSDENVRLNNAISTRDSTKQALADLTALYQHNTEVRSSQISLIAQTKTKLTNNSEDVQSFLNNAI